MKLAITNATDSVSGNWLLILWHNWLISHQRAFQDNEIQAMYLLTDGKPDSSTARVLREVAQVNTIRGVKVHTISFNCEDE